MEQQYLFVLALTEAGLNRKRQTGKNQHFPNYRQLLQAGLNGGCVILHYQADGEFGNRRRL